SDGDAAVGDAAGVGAVGVVELEVLGEVGSEAAVGDVEVAGEAGAPAFVEDRLVEVFDVAVGLGAAGADAGVARVEAPEGGVEAGFELVAVVCEDSFEPPAAAGEVAGDAAGESAGLGRDWLSGRAGDEV